MMPKKTTNIHKPESAMKNQTHCNATPKILDGRIKKPDETAPEQTPSPRPYRPGTRQPHQRPSARHCFAPPTKKPKTSNNANRNALPPSNTLKNRAPQQPDQPSP